MEHTLGKRIMAARKKLGLTQDQLAERLSVTAQAVSKWENDQSCPDIAMLPKLAEIFGTTTDELLGREAPPPVHEAQVIGDAAPSKGESREVLWDNGRRSALAVAALVLLVGWLMLANALLDWGASFWSILWPSALLVFGLSGLFPGFSFFRMGCALFGLCFLTGIILNLDLSGELMLPIILLIFGAGLLFDALRKPKHHFSLCNKGCHQASQNGFQIDSEGFTFSGSFGEQEQSVTLPRLAWGEISTSFGEYRVDLNGVETLAETCRIKASCSFGQLTLLVPRRFRVECDSRTAFAAVDVHGNPDAASQDIIELQATASFGEIEIRYI